MMTWVYKCLCCGETVRQSSTRSEANARELFLYTIKGVSTEVPNVISHACNTGTLGKAELIAVANDYTS